MLIAIPIFGALISPRFDCAARLVFIELEDGSVKDQHEEVVEALHWRPRLVLLLNRDVDVLLCGGIRRCDFQFLVNEGIDVRAGLVGEFEEVLRAFIHGEIPKMSQEEMSSAWMSGRGRRGWGRGRQS